MSDQVIGEIYRAPADGRELTAEVGLPEGYRPRRASFAGLIMLYLGGLAVWLGGGTLITLSEEGVVGEAVGNAGLAAIILAILLLLIMYVLTMVYLHRAWKLVDPQVARTSPGAAVGYQFIPFYNLYWVYQAWHGWAVDYNRSAEWRGSAIRVPAGLFLTGNIFNTVGVIPYLGMLFGLLPFMVIAPVCWWHMCRVINLHAGPHMRGRKS